MTVSAVCLISGLALLALAWRLDRMTNQAFRGWMAAVSVGWRRREGWRYRQSSTYDRWASGTALLGLAFLVVAVVCGLALL